jgi:hypothetical protein
VIFNIEVFTCFYIISNCYGPAVPNSMVWSGSRIIISVPASLSIIGVDFFSVHLSLVAGKSAQIYLSRAASGIIFQDHRRAPVGVFMVKTVTSEHLKRVTVLEEFVELLGVFIESSKIYKFIFLFDPPKN